MTLGSLFDGIGGWLLAARHAGVTPVWASEIEPFPCSVTARHFPDVKQLGDITKIDPDKIEPVDIICAGSPCQDLSIAGKRKGLNGERSGLFRTAVDLVRRMRERTAGKYPRFFVWENVPGAFSSNKGMDFRAVLEEVGQTEIPIPPNGRWANAGLAELPQCQIAWRVLDSQYWGVPQRRRRIFLVADFAADDRRAGEILFEPEGMCGDPETGEKSGKEATRGTEDCARTSSDAVMPFDTTQITSPLNGNHPQYGAPCHPLCASAHIPAVVIKAAGSIGKVAPSTGNIGYTRECAPTLTARMDGNPCSDRGPQIVATNALTPWDVQSRRIYDENGTMAAPYSGDGQGTHNGAVFVHAQAYSFDSLASNSMKSSNPHSGCRKVEIAKTLDTSTPDPSKNQGGIAILTEVTGFVGKAAPSAGNIGYAKELAPTLLAGKEMHVAIYDIQHRDDVIRPVKDGKIPTLTARMGTVGHNVPIVNAYCIAGNTIDRKIENGGNGKGVLAETAYTLNTVDRHAVAEIYGAKSYSEYERGKVATLRASGGAYGGGSENLTLSYSIVRRLTPTECERLQGLEDGYTNGGSDTARYKALGNGMAQPCADYVIRRIVECAKEVR